MNQHLMYKIGVKVLKTYHSACDEHEDYYSKINLKTYQLDNYILHVLEVLKNS